MKLDDEIIVGMETPKGQSIHMRYVGKAKEYRGATALVCDIEGQPQDSLWCCAQFDSYETPWTYGWHKFLRSSFEEIK